MPRRYVKIFAGNFYGKNNVNINPIPKNPNSPLTSKAAAGLYTGYEPPATQLCHPSTLFPALGSPLQPCCTSQPHNKLLEKPYGSLQQDNQDNAKVTCEDG